MACAQISGERLKHHWSFGLFSNFGFFSVILLLIAPVPIHRFNITFVLKTCYLRCFYIVIETCFLSFTVTRSKIIKQQQRN